MPRALVVLGGRVFLWARNPVFWTEPNMAWMYSLMRRPCEARASAVKRAWNEKASQGQILALARAIFSTTVFTPIQIVPSLR